MTHISLVYDVLCWQLLETRIRFFVSYGRKRTVPIPQLVAPPTQIVNPAPQFVIAMKACPGLRSGIDCSSSLSLVIRGIPSSIRPPNRHSGEGRNPGGVGRGKTTRRWKKTDPSPHFHPPMRASQGHGDSRGRRPAPNPDTGRDSRCVG